MEFAKKIEDINFEKINSYGEMIEVSEPIVMASAAGWYVGAICKEDGIIQPYDRYTQYMTKEQAQYCLDTPESEGGFKGHPFSKDYEVFNA
tara:strand:- start:69 stop:341 length:273 start_codon:yes stop_codon:yes gene_type:complete